MFHDLLVYKSLMLLLFLEVIHAFRKKLAVVNSEHSCADFRKNLAFVSNEHEQPSSQKVFFTRLSGTSHHDFPADVVCTSKSEGVAAAVHQGLLYSVCSVD